MLFQRIWSNFNVFDVSNKIKKVEIQSYFNIFHIWFFNFFLFQLFLFIRISNVLFQQISISTYFNKLSSTHFDVFQRVISTLFQPVWGLKLVEIRNLFQRYFNVILTSGFTDVIAGLVDIPHRSDIWLCCPLLRHICSKSYWKHLTGDRIRILLLNLPFVFRDLIAPEVVMPSSRYHYHIMAYIIYDIISDFLFPLSVCCFAGSVCQRRHP